MPSVQFQAAVWGPLLVVGMLILNFLAVVAITRDRFVALFAAIFISACADPAFIDWLYGLAGLNPWQTKTLMHVPAVAMGLGTDQCFGWMLFLPCLSLFHLAVMRRSAVLFLCSGALFGVLFRAHTLTFIDAATVASVYVVVANNFGALRSDSGDLKFRAYVFSALVAGLLAHGIWKGFDLKDFLILWSFCWAFAIRSRSDLLNSVALALGALVIAGSYLWQLFLMREGLAGLNITANTVAGPAAITIFYLPMCIALLLLFAPRLQLWKQVSAPEVVPFLLVFCGTTLALSQGYLFGFTNHPYRFAVNLIFPLSIVLALVVRMGVTQNFAPKSVRVTAILIGIWTSISILKLLIALSGQIPIAKKIWGTTYVRNSLAEPAAETVSFLNEMRHETEGKAGTRLLIAPEYEHSNGKVINSLGADRSGVLLSYSHIPGFLPDTRYILWPDLVRDRFNLFCSLFPEFPHRDNHDQRFCTFGTVNVGTRDGKNLLHLVDPGAAGDIAPVYGLSLAADLSGKLTAIAAKRAPLYGWSSIAEGGGGALYRIKAPAGTERLVIEVSAFTSPIWTIPFTAEKSEPHRIFAAGENAAQRIRSVHVDGRLADLERPSCDVIVFTANLTAGTGRMTFELDPDWRYEHASPVPLHFLTGVPTRLAHQTVVVSGSEKHNEN